MKRAKLEEKKQDKQVKEKKRDEKQKSKAKHSSNQTKDEPGQGEEINNIDKTLIEKQESSGQNEEAENEE